MPATDAGPRVARLNGQPTTVRPAGAVILTDASGNFHASVTPGTYYASAERSGFVGSHDIVTVEGSESATVTLKLDRHGVITGRILDEDGEPMVRAMVQTLKWVMLGGPNGQRTLMPAGESTASTNDLGEYRIFGLSPGKYILSAQPTLRDPVNADRRVYTTHYYPNVTDLSSAQPIAISPGLIRPGIDLRLAKVTTVQLSGKISPLPVPGSERRGVNMMVALQPRNVGSPMGRMDRQRSAPVNSQGEFTLAQVPAGSYTLVANTFGANQDRRTARLNLEVGGRDVDGLAVTLESPLTVNGRFVAEDPAILTGITVHLQPQNSGQNVAAYGRSDAQGRFTINNLEKDIYRVRFNGRPPGYYIKSVQLGTFDSKDTLDLTAGAAGELTIALEKGTAELSGRVLGKDQKPAVQVYVLLINDRQQTSSTQTDVQGRYTLKEITPGDYRLVATTIASYYDPDVLDQLTQQAMQVTLARSGKESRQLELR